GLVEPVERALPRLLADPDLRARLGGGPAPHTGSISQWSSAPRKSLGCIGSCWTLRPSVLKKTQQQWYVYGYEVVHQHVGPEGNENSDHDLLKGGEAPLPC